MQEAAQAPAGLMEIQRAPAVSLGREKVEMAVAGALGPSPRSGRLRLRGE